MHPHHSLCTLVDHRALRVSRGFTIGNPLGCRGSACVEVMTTLHGSAPSLRRHVEGCVPLEGLPSLHMGASEGFQSLCGHSLDSTLPLFTETPIGNESFLLRAFVFLSWLGASFHFVDTYLILWDMFIDHDHLVKDTFSHPHFFERFALITLSFFLLWSSGSQFRSRLRLESHSWRRVGGRLIRADSYPSSDSSVEMSDELTSTLASIQEFMARVSRRLDQIESSHQDPQPISMVTDETVPHASQTAQAIPPRVSLVPPPMVPTIEDTQLAKQEAGSDCGTEFRMPDIKCYMGLVIPTFHLRLYSIVMRSHGIDDAVGGPLSHVTRWSDRDGLLQLSLETPHREDVAHEFRLDSLSVPILMYLDELEATRQRPDESISSFVTRWRAKVVGMIDRPKEQDQIDMVLRNLQSRFARCLVGIPFQDLKSLVQAAFSVEEAIARGLWTDTTPSPDSKGKKPIGPFSKSGEVGAISYQHRRPAHHSLYRPPIVTTHFPHPQYQYQLDYVQEPYIAQTSMQPRPSHPRATTHPPPRFMHKGLRDTFEKLRDGGLIVPLAPRPLPHPIPPHFRSHEHCLYHQIQGHDTERCSTLHHVIQDLIDSGLVNLVGPSVTTNPLLTHSTHAVPPPPSLQ
ncbi:hypothetical protein AAG906_008947 [Vitis piasezkii]